MAADVNIHFAHDALGRLCNSAEAIDRRWGQAAPDVRDSLCILAASPTLGIYQAHPTMTNEGDKTVYKGQHAEVILDLTESSSPRVAVTLESIDVRIRQHTS